LAYGQPVDGSPTQVYIYSTGSGDRELISCSTNGTPGNLSSGLPFVSESGRYVAFVSAATNLVAGDSNGSVDVFIRDRQLGTTERVSLGVAGVQANGESIRPSISADARFVAFESSATNLVAGDTNAASDIFIRDRVAGTTQRVSVSTGGAQRHGFFPRMSADGNRVAFISQASNLAIGDSPAQADVFLHLVQEGTTIRVTSAADGGEINNATLGFDMDRSGHRFAVNTYADNLLENMPGGPGLYALQVDEASNPPKGGKLKFPATVNFGKVQVGTSGDKVMTLRNQGNQPVAGRIFLPPAPFTAGADGYFLLKPHAALPVPLRFHPVEVRKLAGRLNVLSGSKQMHVQLKGAARP
jgi:hypothetical protein